ncbi:GNAT family N-acetyltransferase [Catellatospora sp. NPDC049133]|uniref:GNAT family N-acetyltransferase n=1 Tax=Catellatospora sp. NPDC049133 TaxID=3155499 RepID=UPI0033D9E33D
MRISLTTPRLQLSPFSLADTEELHGLFSDPLTHTIGSGPFTSISQTQQWILNRVTAMQEHGLCMYALRERETNALIGNCGMLKGRTTYTEPEIGYLIGKTHQGHGYAFEAATAVIDECRAAGIRRAWASIRPHNAPSRRIAERLGMRAERIDHDDRGPLIFYVIDLGRETELA